MFRAAPGGGGWLFRASGRMPREGGGLINFTKVHRGEGREQDEEEQNENQEKDNGADVDLEDEN